jgi:hypothetical protein
MSACVASRDAVDGTVWAIARANVDTCDAAARALTELQWLAARSAGYEPFGALVRAWADLTRDTIAVQLSTVRWLLDL